MQELSIPSKRDPKEKNWITAGVYPGKNRGRNDRNGNLKPTFYFAVIHDTIPWYHIL
jgi:hypothetical protein